MTFIGGGNMAVALIGGLTGKGHAAAGIQVVELQAEARARLSAQFGVACVDSVGAAAPLGEVITASRCTCAGSACLRSASNRPSAARRARTFGIRPGVRSLISGPLYHSMQLSNMRTVLAALASEGVMVIEPRFDAERLLALVHEHRITQLMLVPVMFVRLLRLPPSVRRKYDVSSIEWVIHSAAPCPAEVKKAMIEWWGPVINEFYGSTETGPVTLGGGEEDESRKGAGDETAVASPRSVERVQYQE